MIFRDIVEIKESVDFIFLVEWIIRDNVSSIFFLFFYSPSVVSRKESETRRSRNNKIWEAEYSKRFGLPPKYIIRVYFTLVAPCVSRRRGELAERIPRIFVSPNRGEFFALPGPLCAAILLFSFPPSRFFLCGRHAWNHRPETRSSRGKFSTGRGD